MSALENFSLNGKVAIVTGSSGAIGKQIVSGLASAGAIVYGLARRANSSKQKHINYIAVDVTNEEQLAKAISQINLTNGRVDILVNGAGVTMPEGALANWREELSQTIGVNLIAAINSCRIVTPIMLKGGYGSIINITSIGGHLGFPDNPAYGTSKAGLAAFTRAWARDHGARGLRVNNLVPGYIPTEMTKKSYKNKESFEARAGMTMLERWGTVSDISNACIFLASPASSFVTGTDLIVDGGWLARGM